MLKESLKKEEADELKTKLEAGVQSSNILVGLGSSCLQLCQHCLSLHLKQKSFCTFIQSILKG